MKLKLIGCFSFILFGLSTLFILCLTTVGLVIWDNSHLPEHSFVTDKKRFFMIRDFISTKSLISGGRVR